jgi:hypothetical protein
MSNLHRGHSIDASYQVSVHLVSVVCHPFTFHILIVSSENPQPNELSVGMKHLWKVLSKGCTRLTAASDKVYQLLAHGPWFSPGTPASSTTKIGCHDIAEILLKVAFSFGHFIVCSSIYRF